MFCYNTLVPATRVLFLLIAIASFGLLFGCGEDDSPQVYDVPKGTETFSNDVQTQPAQQSYSQPQPTTGTTQLDTTHDGITWTVPDGWTHDDEPRPMRHTTYIAQDKNGEIEIAISQFPGDVGGVLNNVNRWRGQVGLPPVTEDELEDMLEPFQQTGFEGYTIHIAGPTQHMLVASVFESSANRTWFVRAILTSEQADRLKDTLRTFAQSFSHP